MTKIIKHGILKSNQSDSPKQYICNSCKCEFEVDSTDFVFSNEGEWLIVCPECGKVVCEVNIPNRDTYRRDKIIEEIVKSMEYTDDGEVPSEYERIHDVMEALDWTWASCNGIPTIEEIKNESIKRMQDAWDKKTTLSSGGFTSSYGHDEDTDEEWLELKFEIASICQGIDRNNEPIYY